MNHGKSQRANEFDAIEIFCLSVDSMVVAASVYKLFSTLRNPISVVVRAFNLNSDRLSL